MSLLLTTHTSSPPIIYLRKSQKHCETHVLGKRTNWFIDNVLKSRT